MVLVAGVLAMILVDGDKVALPLAQVVKLIVTYSVGIIKITRLLLIVAKDWMMLLI